MLVSVDITRFSFVLSPTIIAIQRVKGGERKNIILHGTSMEHVSIANSEPGTECLAQLLL